MNRDNRYFIAHFRGLMAGVLLIVFAVYYINITLFAHYHVVDGVTIVHSHFYSDVDSESDAESHQHSKGELTLIQIISNFVVESQLIYSYLPEVALSDVRLLGQTFCRSISLNLSAHPQLRAPPAESLIG